MSDQNHDEENHKHHILTNAMGLKILGALFVLTAMTVISSRIDLGVMNGPIAVFIACLKAMLVVLFFMGMKYDTNDNRIFFSSSFVFFAIFVVLTCCDVFTRGDWRVTGEVLKASAGGGSEVKKFWVPSDEIKAHGKELYTSQACFTCHGDQGRGDGIAAGALNPRNFAQAEGWKNGRKATQIVTTLEKGLNAMPQFANLSLQDRFALAAYVQSFGPAAPEDSPEDLQKVGIKDPSRDDGGFSAEGAQKRVLPLDFAIDRYIDSPK